VSLGGGVVGRSGRRIVVEGVVVDGGGLVGWAGWRSNDQAKMTGLPVREIKAGRCLTKSFRRALDDTEKQGLDSR
jgi:hypothetical protein